MCKRRTGIVGRINANAFDLAGESLLLRQQVIAEDHAAVEQVPLRDTVFGMVETAQGLPAGYAALDKVAGLCRSM